MLCTNSTSCAAIDMHALQATNLTSSKIQQKEAGDTSALSAQQLPTDMHAAVEMDKAVSPHRLSAQPEAVLVEFSDSHADCPKTTSLPSQRHSLLSSTRTAVHAMQPLQRSISEPRNILVRPLSLTALPGRSESSQRAKAVTASPGAAEQLSASAVASKPVTAKDATAFSLGHVEFRPPAILQPVVQTTAVTSANAGSVHSKHDGTRGDPEAMAGSIESLLQALAVALAAASPTDADDGDERSSISNT